jgi:hypothetical protein
MARCVFHVKNFERRVNARRNPSRDQRELLWGIASRPKEYGKVTWNIYQAQSRTLGLTVPKLKILFGFKDETENEVILLWIEEVTDLEGIGDSET